ncbi:Alpha/Beta hydrolase protein [Xylariaceae sp. FL1651]|nr:Alpha/Beta hydrolase protein [Xylariaceae sp. FL1651]
MPCLNIGGSSIFYVDEGDGPPLLFIHGWTCDVQDWVFQLPYFQALGYRTIAFDTRGHGRSSVPQEGSEAELSPETTVNDAVMLLEQLGITNARSVTVFGHSSGCLIASLLALRQPTLVKALVLISPMYYRPAAEGLAPGRKLDSDAHGFVNKIFEGSGTVETPGWLTTWHRIRLLGVSEFVVREAAYQREPLSSWESVQGILPKRICPRLVTLPNELNRVKEKQLGMGMHDRIEVINSGHWMHLQDSSRFNTLVRDWLVHFST